MREMPTGWLMKMTSTTETRGNDEVMREADDSYEEDGKDRDRENGEGDDDNEGDEEDDNVKGDKVEEDDGKE